MSGADNIFTMLKIIILLFIIYLVWKAYRTITAPARFVKGIFKLWKKNNYHYLWIINTKYFIYF